MRILVTGGAGYIGSHTIIDILENSNHQVVSLDNFYNSEPASFDRIEAITGTRVKNYNVDLTDYQAAKNVFENEAPFDGIIHFAALKAVGESVDMPLKYYYNNLNGLINILKCAFKFKVTNFIFSSSCTVYGNASQLPVTEESPVREAESPYGYTKLFGEKILKDFTLSYDTFNALSLRYFNPVGAHMSGNNGEIPVGKPNNLLPIVTQFASGWIDQLSVYGNDYETRDGTAIRDYIHVSDIAHAHLLALEYLYQSKSQVNYDVFNLGTGNGVTVLEVIKAFESIADMKLDYKMGPRRNGDVEAIYADNSKAKRLLGWQLNHNIEDAVRSAWQWQQNLNNTKNDGKAHP